MSEEFLHYIWKFRLFDQLVLQTTAGEPVEIVKVGEHNFDSGPDFFNAKIKVGKTLWAGNVEVHINSSDWKKNFQRFKIYQSPDASTCRADIAIRHYQTGRRTYVSDEKNNQI